MRPIRTRIPPWTSPSVWSPRRVPGPVRSPDAPVSPSPRTSRHVHDPRPLLDTAEGEAEVLARNLPRHHLARHRRLEPDRLRELRPHERRDRGLLWMVRVERLAEVLERV